MRYIFLLVLVSCAFFSSAQNYVVNTIDDMDDGSCDGVHCSLREAIKAAEADGMPSTIRFNIPGAGQQNINPTGPFPTITQNDLTILGESQPGGAGTIVIDFNYRNFMGIGFWDILASRFYISGIDFTDYLFDNPGDHLFQFGDLTNNARDCRIFNCSFITDNSFVALPSKNLINIFSADNLSISNCNFGTDNSRSFISKLDGYIHIDGNQGNGQVTIDSNFFVNRIISILWQGGQLNVSKNIFGALDTTKAANFLNPEYAIRGFGVDQQGVIHDNFFIGFVKRVIEIGPRNTLTISKNRFYNSIQDMVISGNGMDVVNIVDNFARNGRMLLSSNGIGEMYFERNNISNYDTVWHNLNSVVNQKIRHIDNRMTCINDRVIIMDPSLVPSHQIPVITTVNRNQVTGSGNPNDSVIVYSNNRLACPNTVCQAGVELGRTQADATGNWILTANYPNRTTISAYQFDSNPSKRPTRYSEFSPCYQCLAEVKLKFNQTLCSGQSVNYRGKIYSESNPTDSIFVRGDGVSICDSVILVDIKFNTGYRIQLDTSVCYEDTLRFGNVVIHKNHLSDSLLLKSIVTAL
jgi:CSLREA domain-containing protein